MSSARRRLKLTTRITLFNVALFLMLAILAMLLITIITLNYLDRRIRIELSEVAGQLSGAALSSSHNLYRYGKLERLERLHAQLEEVGIYDHRKYQLLLVDSDGRSSFDSARIIPSMRPLVQKAASQMHEDESGLYFRFSDYSSSESAGGRIEMTIDRTADSFRAPAALTLQYRNISGEAPVIHRDSFLGSRVYYHVLPLQSEPGHSIYVALLYFAKSEADFVINLNSALLFASAVGTGVLLTFGTVFARSALMPLRDLSEAAGSIDFERLNDRIPRPDVDDEISHLVDSLNRMLANLQNAYDYQKRFTSDASHELRIPLTIIIGYLDLIRRYGPEDPALFEEALSAVESEAAHMKELTDSLLLLTRLENNKVKPNIESFGLAPLLERLTAESRLLYPDRVFEYEAPNELTLYSDENLLTQVIRSFVENSVKYSDPNTLIRLVAGLAPDDADSGRAMLVVIRVEDRGFGIPEDRIAKLTKRFYRVDEDRSRESGGTGLGLAIADGIIRALKGRLKIESQPGAGTVVSVLLPPFAPDAGPRDQRR